MSMMSPRATQSPATPYSHPPSPLIRPQQQGGVSPSITQSQQVGPPMASPIAEQPNNMVPGGGGLNNNNVAPFCIEYDSWGYPKIGLKGGGLGCGPPPFRIEYDSWGYPKIGLRGGGTEEPPSSSTSTTELVVDPKTEKNTDGSIDENPIERSQETQEQSFTVEPLAVNATTVTSSLPNESVTNETEAPSPNDCATVNTSKTAALQEKDSSHVKQENVEEELSLDSAPVEFYDAVSKVEEENVQEQEEAGVEQFNQQHVSDGNDGGETLEPSPAATADATVHNSDLNFEQSTMVDLQISQPVKEEVLPPVDSSDEIKTEATDLVTGLKEEETESPIVNVKEASLPPPLIIKTEFSSGESLLSFFI